MSSVTLSPACRLRRGTQQTYSPHEQRRNNNPWANGRVFFIWGHGHSYEFADRNDWGALERIYKPLAGKSDVWYCTNIQLSDYEEAGRRMVIDANRRSAWNPSATAVTLSVDGKLLDVPAGQTVQLTSPAAR